MNAQEIAEVARLAEVAKTAVREAQTPAERNQLEGLVLGLELVLLMAVDRDEYLAERQRLFPSRRMDL